MPIEFHCKCGALIRVPEEAAGKRGRCKSCAAIVHIPRKNSPQNESLIPLAPEEDEGVADNEQVGEDWLNDFAGHEAAAAGAAPVVIPSPPHPSARETDRKRRLEAARHMQHDSDHEWVQGPERSFLGDVGESFIFFLSANNLSTLIVLIILNLLGAVGSVLPFPFGFILQCWLLGYLCSFYMSVVAETAGGEDELPTPTITNFWDDLWLPLFRFLLTFAFTMIPVFALFVVDLFIEADFPRQVYIPLSLACMFFWPVVMLAVSIGGGFSGLGAHVVVRTVSAAPLGYFVVWATILLAFGITYGAREGIDWAQAGGILPDNLQVSILASFLGLALSLYAMIVSMRTIGLYYRHFKSRLPWQAE